MATLALTVPHVYVTFTRNHDGEVFSVTHIVLVVQYYRVQLADVGSFDVNRVRNCSTTYFIKDCQLDNVLVDRLLFTDNINVTSCIVNIQSYCADTVVFVQVNVVFFSSFIYFVFIIVYDNRFVAPVVGLEQVTK